VNTQRGRSNSGKTNMDVMYFLAGLLGVGLLIGDSVRSPAAAEAAPDPGLVERGSYLAKAADCMPCHTSARDKPFAGGLRMNTPFGAIYSPNITPDRDTGIGAWSFDAFRGAVHSGIRADGKYLYPAMPFDAFTMISEDDLKALWAYFRSVTPVKQPNRENELTFPFSIRYGMLAWRLLFFRERAFTPDATKSAPWNRGAYLVEALGHCGDCHTPRNFMGATVASKRFQGAQIDQWYAPSITAEALSKANRWGKSQLIAFLAKGSASNSSALGPMREVVHDSLSFLTASDLDAMASYLLDLSGEKDPPKPKPVPVAKKLAPEVEKHAAKLYADNCASCHQAGGQGIAGSIPPVAGNPAVAAAKPFDVLAVVLQGIPARADFPAMPSFAGSLNDSDVADLTNYLRTSFGNQAAPNATPAMVATWRATLSLPVYASDAARRFDCPSVGQGASADLDPGLIAALGGELAQRSVAYATLVQKYKAQFPDAGMADIVNNLVAAYCPVVAKSDMSDQAKSLAVKRFALNITSYLSSQSATEAEPDVGIIWAVPLGYSLAERDPSWQPALTCPANDNSRVPQALVAAAVPIRGKVDLNFPAMDAIAQADKMLAANPKAKLADLANALILAFCEGVAGLSNARDVEKTGALMRYGEEVIQRLQLKAELAERAPAARAAR
jgi:mono/diheme cytochrome c family protein